MKKKPLTKTRRKGPPLGTVPVQYQAARGSPFADSDAEVIGPELVKIAEANRVGDIRSLDKKLVFEVVEADEHHPLRQFYDWDDERMARQARLERTALMIRSIRILTPSLPELSRPSPLVLFDPDHVQRRSNAPEARRRSHVLIQDVVNDDPTFISSLTAQIVRIRQGVERLDHVAALRKTPMPIRRLVSDLAAAFAAYDGSEEAAAAE